MENNLGVVKKEIQISLFSGLKGVAEIKSGKFIKEWEQLIKDCPWSGVFQSPNLIISWYETYQEACYPLIIAGFIDKRLIGLLPTALMGKSENDILDRTKPLKFVGAGNYLSLEQTLITREELISEFWDKGLNSFFLKFPNSRLNLRYLPNQFPISAIENNNYFINYSVSRTFSNPILNFNKSYADIFKKRHLKAKYNRLQRAGILNFEKVLDFASFKKGLEEIILFLEIRHGAAFNKRSFLNDINQKYLFFNWFKLGLLHVTFLKLNEEIISAVALIIDGKRLHLAGLTSYSPVHAKFSPGIVHLFLLGQLIRDEGFGEFKLSPGYDSYKNRFSNDVEIVQEILISKNKNDIFLRRLRVFFDHQLLNLNYRPMGFNVGLDKIKSIFKSRLGYLKLSAQILLRGLSLKKAKDSNIDINAINFQHNRLNDLLKFEENRFPISRWEFLNDALERLESGEEFLTLLHHDKLIGFIWIDKDSIPINILRIKIFELEKIKKIFLVREYKNLFKLFRK